MQSAGVAPFVNDSIAPLQTELGVYFRYLVPEYTFLDSEYGTTRNLSLQLDRVLGNGSVVDIQPDYWVQFMETSQVVCCVLTED